MKLVTTWAALSELGPNYVWRTEFMTEPGARPDARARCPARCTCAPAAIRSS